MICCSETTKGKRTVTLIIATKYLKYLDGRHLEGGAHLDQYL
jgi:hypothetical protein